MKSRGIIFSSEMVKALLAGRKTVTRRLDRSWLKYKKGDEIWVRETWNGNREVGICYKATEPLMDGCPWRPSIFMPRWASRLSFVLTEDARLEKLQDITEDEAIMEGIVLEHYNNMHRLRATPFKNCFGFLWNSLHTKENRWEDNPKVVRLCWQ